LCSVKQFDRDRYRFAATQAERSDSAPATVAAAGIEYHAIGRLGAPG